MKPEENIYNSICDVIDGLVDVSEFDEYVEQTSIKEYYNDQQSYMEFGDWRTR